MAVRALHVFCLSLGVPHATSFRPRVCIPRFFPRTCLPRPPSSLWDVRMFVHTLWPSVFLLPHSLFPWCLVQARFGQH